MAETLGIFLVESLVEVAGSTALTDAAVAFAEGSFLGISGATAIGTAAIIGATIGLQYALGRPDLPKPENGSQALKQSIPPRIMGYGRNRLAGYYMLFEAVGSVAQSYDVMAFHSGRIGAVRGLYLHDDRITTSSDLTLGGVSNVNALDGKYGPVAIEIKLGAASQTVSTILSTDGLISPIWDSSHKGNGIAYAVLSCGGIGDPSEFSNVYPHNLPLLSVVADCAPVWDPRDGAQSRLNPATWLVSTNPVLQLIDYLTRADGGMGLDYDIVIAPNITLWMAEANLCDEPVATASGTEPRYSSNGWFLFDNGPSDIVGGILATCDGWLAESGDGSLSLVVGVYRIPFDAPLTEKHIFGFALNYGQADEQTVNELDISFTDPAQNYVTVQTEPWRDEDAIALAGVVRPQALELKWVQSNSQARRLADRASQRLNPLMTGSFTTSLAGLRFLGRRWVPLQYPFVSGLQNCVVEIQNAEVDLKRGRIVWQFIRISPDKIEAYNPATDEGTPPLVPPSLAPPRMDFTKTLDSQYLALLEDI